MKDKRKIKLYWKIKQKTDGKLRVTAERERIQVVLQLS